jgi:bacteriorhodopsin
MSNNRLSPLLLQLHVPDVPLLCFIVHVVLLQQMIVLCAPCWWLVWAPWRDGEIYQWSWYSCTTQALHLEVMHVVVAEKKAVRTGGERGGGGS